MKSLLSILAALALGLTATGCDSAAASPGEGQGVTTPAHYIVLIDISASRSQETLDEAKHFLDQLIQRLSFGDQIVLLQVQQEGLSDHPKRGTVTMPVPEDPTFVTTSDRARLAAAEGAVTSAVPSYFTPKIEDNGKTSTKDTGKVMHTDIFATLHIAGEYASDAGDQSKVLILLSDMLQSAQGIEMEGLVRMPPSGWVEAQKRAGLLSKFRRTCVLVVGADATTTEGARVRDFWIKYFATAGASLTPANYRATAPAASAPVCN